MVEPTHAARMRRFFAEIWNQGNLQLIDELFAPDYIGRVFPDLPWSDMSLAGLKQNICYARTALPDLQISILHQFGNDDVVITHWIGAGTHRGMFFGLSPQQQQVKVSGMSITRLIGVQVAEHWDHWNRSALLLQLQGAPTLATMFGRAGAVS